MSALYFKCTGIKGGTEQDKHSTAYCCLPLTWRGLDPRKEIYGSRKVGVSRCICVTSIRLFPCSVHNEYEWGDWSRERSTQPFEMVKHTCNDQELVVHYATDVKIHVLDVKSHNIHNKISPCLSIDAFYYRGFRATTHFN